MVKIREYYWILKLRELVKCVRSIVGDARDSQLNPARNHPETLLGLFSTEQKEIPSSFWL